MDGGGGAGAVEEHLVFAKVFAKGFAPFLFCEKLIMILSRSYDIGHGHLKSITNFIKSSKENKDSLIKSEHKILLIFT